MADKMQALLGGNPMIKSVLSNPKQMKMAQEMLRNPEMQKQIGGVISNPTVIAKASEVLSGLQQMNTNLQSGGRKRFRKKRSRRRKGGSTMSPEAQFRTSREMYDLLKCPSSLKNIGFVKNKCQKGRDAAFAQNPSDMGEAWLDYNFKYLEGQISKRKIGDSHKVCKRVSNWIKYINQYYPTMWVDMKWYDDMQEKRRQNINKAFSHISISPGPVPKAVAGEWPTWWNSKVDGIKNFVVDVPQGFLKGGKRKSRRKKRRKSKKRKSRRKKRRKKSKKRKSRRRRRR